jgi:hypothetical protein
LRRNHGGRKVPRRDRNADAEWLLELDDDALGLARRPNQLAVDMLGLFAELLNKA